MVLRQSVKLLIAVYVICGLLEIAIALYWTTLNPFPDVPVWVPLLLPLFFQFIAAMRHISRMATKMTVTGDRIRYESGLLSKTTRVMELAKVQDVRCDQSLGQRMLNVGNLSLETAGETSRIVMPSIDRPQAAAEHILELSKSARVQQQTLTPPGEAPRPTKST
jgi:uncharacterized membrane protein YdbT with pleckstrin-like domain